MVAMLETPVAKGSPKSRKPAEDDEDDISTVAVARDVAGWVTDISRYATRKAKKIGLPMGESGKARIKNAVIIDAFLRRAVWELKMRCENHERGLPPTEKIPPPPPCVLGPLPVELP